MIQCLLLYEKFEESIHQNCHVDLRRWCTCTADLQNRSRTTVVEEQLTKYTDASFGMNMLRIIVEFWLIPYECS